MEDHIQLQKDLDALSKWGDAWRMKFNESKCNILTITNLETTTTWFYTLNSVILQHVDSAKYLGIRIHKSLRFSGHINATAKKLFPAPWIPPEDPMPVPPRTERTGLHQPSKILCWVWRSGMGSVLEERQTSIGEDPESSREMGEWSQALPAS